MATREQLIQLLEQMTSKLRQNNIDHNEMVLLQQYYTKSRLLQTNVCPEEDDWSYISFGICLKQAFKGNDTGGDAEALGDRDGISYASRMISEIQASDASNE